MLSMRRTGYEASGAFNLIFVVEGRMFRFKRMIERERERERLTLCILTSSCGFFTVRCSYI